MSYRRKIPRIDLSVKGDASIAVASESKSTQLNQQGFNYSLSPQITLQAGQFSKPLINVWAHRRVYKFWQWNTAGFARETEITVEEFDSFEARWENLQNLPSNEGGPSDGDPS